jgi:hypothetical protein
LRGLVVSNPPVNTALPVITQTGSVLSVTTGTWTGTAPITYAYQWSRNGTPISGATASTYTIPDADLNALFGCIVTATNVGGNASAAAGLLYVGVMDVLSVAPAANYELRRESRSYTGNAIRVRRSSDNAEADIGFTANGDLDTTALLAHVGSGNGFVTTLYDQSGNGRNATQTTYANQPRIVNNGVIETQNGRATVSQSNQNQTLPISATFTGLTSATGIFVFRQLTDNGGAHDFRPQANTSNNHSPFSNGTAYDSFFSESRQVFNNYGPASSPSTNTLTIHTVRQTGTALQLFKNGTQIDGDKTVSFQLPDMRSLFSSSPTGTVALSAGVIFGALPIAERQLIERNRGAYYGIPISS